MKKPLIISLIALLLLITGAAVLYGVFELTERSREAHKDTLRIVASIYPLAFFAEQVVQETGEVTTLTPPGTEPHDYELTARDIARMQDADLVIINGNLEPWADDIHSLLQGSDTPLLIASDGLATQATENSHEHEGENEDNHEEETALDPHIWLDPILAKQAMLRITNAIKKADPQRASEHMERAQQFELRFDELDRLYQDGLAACESQNIITSHAAFHYLADRYHLTQTPISGISPEEEPSTQDLIAITDFVQENSVQYIFFESLVSPKLAETIANETGAQVLELNPLEGLSAHDIQQGKDYFSVMESNLRNLQTALSCT